MRMGPYPLLGLALALLAAGCVTAPPVPPPVTQYSGQNCADAAALSGALGLTPEKEKDAHRVTTAVNAQTPCLRRGEATTPYIVYALPADFGDKTLNIGGLLEGARIFAPDVSILDAQGQVTRTFRREDYLFRSGAYSVQFRPREGEAYVLVAADPTLVGQRYDSIFIGTNTTTYSSGYATMNWTSGVDASQSRTFSYEGSVLVSVYDSDTEEGR